MKIKNRRKFFKWLCIIAFSPIMIMLICILLVGVFADIPSFKELEDPQSNLATQILAEDGSVLTTFHIENRSYVSFDELPENLTEALVATEDVRFYKHSGIDFKSLVRVSVKSLLFGNRRSGGGGSTITQQLAKSLYPRDTVTVHFPGARYAVLAVNKFKEWITAVKLERDYTKEEILSMYLNAVFYGSNAYGIRAASNTFFGKDPVDLDLQESALLVGIVNMPTRYNPVRHPELALKRRNHVLSQMEKYGYLDKKTYDSIVKLPIKLSFSVQDNNSGLAPYFRDMLKKTMSAREPVRSRYSNYDNFIADSTLWHDDPLYGWLNKNKKPDGSKYNLDKDGLRIYTPINARMQKYAEQAVSEYLGNHLQPLFNRELKWRSHYPFSNDTPLKVRELIMKQARRWSDRYMRMKRNGVPVSEIMASFRRKTEMRVFSWNDRGYVDTLMTPDDSIKYYKSFLRAGLLSMEPGTGYVKAYVGGDNYRYFKYDQVSQGSRQVGSTFKPFLYTLAMQEGYTPCDKVVNVPQSFPVNDTIWTPRSTDKKEWIGRTVTIKWGLTHSSNNISAYLMKQFGPDALVNMAHNMGIKVHLDPVYSLCVGSADIPVYQMVSAFNTFPSRGVFIDPVFVLRIEDKTGNILSTFTQRKKEAISAQTAYLMVNLMRGVVDHGTGARIRSLYIRDGQIAGKTGTTNNQSDGWFIGYMPKLTTGIWVGAEDRQVHFRSLALGSGSNMALPVWGIYMKKVLADGTLGISVDDKFEVPKNFNVELDCSGDDSESGEKNGGENYFEDF
ncbi:MAG: transglycosylase domain-containing protein [Bacteroidales bacterium]|nr:transglycosylase domain-containing protein [Bacteroidales bacterium]